MTKGSLDKIAKHGLQIWSWLSFAIALTFYWVTVDPGVSYWDCAEYVTAASRLEIGHPPGNPVWILVMRIATIPFPPQYHALVINIFSGIFMAFATFFLCRIIYILLVLLIIRNRLFYSFGKTVKRSVAGLAALGGALCFALCDSAWYSAVEAEVYAMSAFLSALSIWIMSVWWFEKSGAAKFRLLVLLAYIIGLSLGVHQLNLLLIPVFALIIIYKYNRNRINVLKLILYIFCSFAAIGIILMGIMPGVLFGAARWELFSVNKLDLPYHSGIVIFMGILMVLFLIVRAFSANFTSPLSKFNLTVWALFFIVIGFSSYGIILIRGIASPPMNEGSPSDIFALSSYIAREQYPSSPLIYGSTPYSRPVLQEEFIEGNAVFSRYALKKEKPVFIPTLQGARLNHRSGMLSHKDSSANNRIMARGKGYILSDYRFSQLLTPELDAWFPRITSRQASDIEAYKDWAGMTKDNMSLVSISEAIDTAGNFVPLPVHSGSNLYSYRPTYTQHLRFFLAYQAYYMYFRYLFWNFIGRQNDFSSMGEIEHGNFITGIPAIDSNWLGVTSEMPSELGETNKGRNRYYGIPFLLGIIGLFWLLTQRRIGRRIDSLILLTFLMTGLAIVVYLNQGPGEPRERDYTFLVSYMAFAMWISAGIMALCYLASRLGKGKFVISTVILFSIGTPTLMALENFDDHDRRGRFEPTFYARSLLEIPVPSVIFSHGDNSTFPLWYASEVLQLNPENIPVDITYLSLPSYIVNLKKQGNMGIHTLATTPELAFGAFVLTKIPHDSISEAIPLTKALTELYKSSKTIPEFPSSRIKICVQPGDSIIVNLRDFTGGSSYLSFKHLMLLDMMASAEAGINRKALYFPSLIDYSFYRPVDAALRPVLFGKIYAPWLSDQQVNAILDSHLDKELSAINELNPLKHYADPVGADRSRRYRGELILTAKNMLVRGEDAKVKKIVEAIETHYPYSQLSPGDFTMADSTFFEGKAFSVLMNDLYAITGDPSYPKSKESVDSLMERRHKEFVRYYYSLSPEQRATLSNRSRRQLKKL